MVVFSLEIFLIGIFALEEEWVMWIFSLNLKKKKKKKEQEHVSDKTVHVLL